MSKPKNMTPEQEEVWKVRKRALNKAYSQTPEYKTYNKARRQTPEYKAYQKAYSKAYNKAYHQTPEYKAYQKAYGQTQERKAYHKAYKKKLIQQSAADQFFIMAGAAEQISKIKTT
jgi:hypothetical protein